MLVVSSFGMAGAPAAQAQSCCNGQNANAHSNSAMGSAAAATSQPASHITGAVASLPQPVQSVFNHYTTVQIALVQDSLTGIPDAARAMAKAITGDASKLLSVKVAQQAETLARAKNLETARQAFKPLSESLIQYLKDPKTPASGYYEAYCPMAKASWLQTDKTVLNPYMGKSMVHCGSVKSVGEWRSEGAESQHRVAHPRTTEGEPSARDVRAIALAAASK